MNIQSKTADATNRGVSPRTARLGGITLVILVINYFVSLASSLLGVSFVSAASMQNIPLIPFSHELARMDHSAYYSQYADAYAGFMLVIFLLFMLSTVLLSIVFVRRTFVLLRLIGNQKLESVSWFLVTYLFYFTGAYLWGFGWDSVFFNPNPKIGGNYYWFTTLLISINWMVVAPMSVFLALAPGFFSYSIFEDPPDLRNRG